MVVFEKNWQLTISNECFLSPNIYLDTAQYFFNELFFPCNAIKVYVLEHLFRLPGIRIIVRYIVKNVRYIKNFVRRIIKYLWYFV